MERLQVGSHDIIGKRTRQNTDHRTGGCILGDGLIMSLTNNDLERLAELVAEQVGDIVSANSCHGRWLTLREAMQYARVKSPNTIKKWIDEGYIYAFKRSGEWIVDRESVDDWYSSEKLT